MRQGTNEDGTPYFGEINCRGVAEQVAGNPGSSAIVHPGQQVLLMQGRNNTTFQSPGNTVLWKDVVSAVTENDLWRSFEDVTIIRSEGTVTDIKRVKATGNKDKGDKYKNVIHIMGKDGKPTKHEVSSKKDLLVGIDDVVLPGQPLTKGDLLCKGNPFLMIPLYFRSRRYYGGWDGDGRCNAPDGNQAKFLPSWSCGNQYYKCGSCPKKAEKRFPDDPTKSEKKCEYSVVITFIGGPDLNTLFRVTLKKTNRRVYHDYLFPAVRGKGYPHTFCFLMDSEERTSKNNKNIENKWWVYSLRNQGRTPEWLLPHCMKAYQIIYDHYEKENEMIKQCRENNPMPVPPPAPYSAPQPAQYHSNDDIAPTPQPAPYPPAGSQDDIPDEPPF